MAPATRTRAVEPLAPAGCKAPLARSRACRRTCSSRSAVSAAEDRVKAPGGAPVTSRRPANPDDAGVPGGRGEPGRNTAISIGTPGLADDRSEAHRPSGDDPWVRPRRGQRLAEGAGCACRPQGSPRCGADQLPRPRPRGRISRRTPGAFGTSPKTPSSNASEEGQDDVAEGVAVGKGATVGTPGNVGELAAG